MRVPLLNFERGPGSLDPGSRGSGSWGLGPTFTPCPISNTFVTLYFLNQFRIYQELKCNVAWQANTLQYKK